MEADLILQYDLIGTAMAMKNTQSADNEDHTKIFVTSIELTAIQRKIFNILADGDPHSIDDILRNALGKRFASTSLVPTHINRMRQKLAGKFLLECEAGHYVMRRTTRNG